MKRSFEAFRGTWRRGAVVAAAALSLAACATAPSGPPAAGRWGVNGTMKPYAVNGVRYTPRDQPHYDATGWASWYAEGSPRRRTADGEVFDASRPSAAHTTLPLPCLVEVTNLDNGRRARLRVNDRGPFARGRILDVSRRAAEELGFLGQGMARVRVRYIGSAGVSVASASAATAPQAPPAAPPPAGPPGATSLALARDVSAPGARIQAGAFATLGAARRAAASLAGEGAASIESVDRGGAILYRVVVTPPAGTDPEAARARIAAAGFGGARLAAAS